MSNNFATSGLLANFLSYRITIMQHSSNITTKTVYFMCTVFCEVHMFTHKKSRYCDLLSGNPLLDKLQAMTHQKAYAQNLNIFKNISFF